MKTICGRNRSAVKKAAAKFGWENTQTEWRRVIDDRKIDIVDICTPNDSHCEIAIAAAKAGKAILCEKPLARNVAEAEKMARFRAVSRVPAVSRALQSARISAGLTSAMGRPVSGFASSVKSQRFFFKVDGARPSSLSFLR